MIIDSNSARVHCVRLRCSVCFVCSENKYLFNMFNESIATMRSMTSIWMHNWVRACHAHVSHIFFRLKIINTNNFFLQFYAFWCYGRFRWFAYRLSVNFIYFCHFVFRSQPIHAYRRTKNHNINTIWQQPIKWTTERIGFLDFSSGHGNKIKYWLICITLFLIRNVLEDIN